MNNNCTFAIRNPDPKKMLKGFYSGKEKPFSDGNSKMHEEIKNSGNGKYVVRPL